MLMNKKKIFIVLVLALVLLLTGCFNSATTDDNSDNNKCTLTVYVLGEGKVTPGEGTYSYEKDTTITLTTEATGDYSFNGWSGEDSSGIVKEDGKWKVLMDQDKVITAIFTDGETINFIDEDLEQVVREELAKQTGDITLQEVKAIDRLSISHATIESFQGIQFLPNLSKLYIRNSEIKCDLIPLANSDSLIELRLGETTLTDINDLNYLTNLSYLQVFNDQLKSLDPIDNLTQLTALNISSSELSDISKIDTFTNLKDLYLQNGQITDISKIGNLTNLQRLGINGNQVKSITALSDLNLEAINIGDNPINDLQETTGIIANMSNVTSLSLRSLGIEDVSFLKKFYDLEFLGISDNPISDLQLLKEHILKMDNIEYLSLTEIGLEDIQFLLNLSQLKSVTIWRNNLDLSEGSEDMKVINELEANDVNVSYELPY